MSENDKTKKARRQWLYYNESNELKTKEIGFNLDQLTLDAKLFLRLYGCKQYLADCIASKGGIEFSDKERADTMQERFVNLCDEKFKITHTEAGFYFRDPDAVATKRGSGVIVLKIYNACLLDGKTADEAKAFVLSVTGKPMPEELIPTE